MIKKLHTKFCIIGTGAGGSMLAYRLAQAGADVLIVNSGKIPDASVFTNELSPEQQGHFEIRKDTRFPAKPEVSLIHPLMAEGADKSTSPRSQNEFHHHQIHHVNGLQNLWNGIALRYSEDDFANRNSYNDQCQWPITYNDLAHHYSEVEQLGYVVGNRDQQNQFPDGSFLPPRAPRRLDRLFIDANANLFSPDLYCFANRKTIDLREDSAQKCKSCGSCARGCRAGSIYKFSTHLLPQIKGLQNFRMLEHTRVLKLITINNSKNFEISEVHAINETTGEPVTIQAEVVLLCAGALESPRIILNSLPSESTEQVGLYLQDNPRVAVASSLFRLWFKPITENRGYGDHILLGGQLRSQRRSVRFVAQLWSNFIKVPHYLPNLQFLPHFLRELIAKQIYKSTAVLIFYGPAVPQRENRVTLSDELDRFSQRQVQVNYRIPKQEIENNLGLQNLARKLLKRASGYMADLVPTPPGTGIHYVGTCRMGPSAANGVVDKDLKFFGAQNFYICDGSVIPVLSEKHPTLTIMALAHRLAEHVIEKYK